MSQVSSSPPNPWWTVQNWWNAALISRHAMVISQLGSQNHRLCALGVPLFNHSHQRRLETIGRSGRHLEENWQNQRFEFQAAGMIGICHDGMTFCISTVVMKGSHLHMSDWPEGPFSVDQVKKVRVFCIPAKARANVCKTTKWNEILWKTGMFPLFDYKACAMHVTMRRDWTVTGPVRELAFPWMIAEKLSRLCEKVESISRMWIQSCLPPNSRLWILVFSEAKFPVPTRLTSWLCRLVGTSL